MKAIALANRLSRDFAAKSVIDLTADARLEILDAINGTLQTLHNVSHHASKKTTAALFVAAPKTVEITIENGSAEITGYEFLGEDQYKTIKVGGDPIYNQISGPTNLLHSCNGSGTVTAVIYSDAVQLPEQYSELVGDPLILDTSSTVCPGTKLVHQFINRRIARPLNYWVEANARNQSPAFPAVIRFDPMPDRAYRMEVEALLAPLRVSFSDLLAPGLDLPLRSEHVEAYLIPIARAKLTHSRNWADKEDIASTRDDAKEAEAKYEALTPRTLSTPRNRVVTKPGF